MSLVIVLRNFFILNINAFYLLLRMSHVCMRDFFHNYHNEIYNTLDMTEEDNTHLTTGSGVVLRGSCSIPTAHKIRKYNDRAVTLLSSSGKPANNIRS